MKTPEFLALIFPVKTEDPGTARGSSYWRLKFNHPGDKKEFWNCFFFSLQQELPQNL
jgi:hypothetical protein